MLSISDTAQTLEAITAGVDPELFPMWNAHPLFGDFSRRLLPCVEKLADRHAVNTFAVMRGDDIHLLAACTASDEGASNYGLPIVLAPRHGLGGKQLKQAIAQAIEHIVALAGQTKGRKTLIMGAPTGQEPGAIDNACIGRLAAPTVRIHGIVDVADGEPAIHRNLRKSFRSLVNWGRDHLDMRYLNANNPDRDLLNDYAEFHAHISGGHAHSPAYWDVIWDEALSGRGELSLGYLQDGTLASGTFSTQAATTAYYTSGVYDREKFDLPLGHFPLFDAMVRAAQRGAGRFDLGEIVPLGAASSKEAQIGFFKKGFAERCELTLTWTMTAP